VISQKNLDHLGKGARSLAAGNLSSRIGTGGNRAEKCSNSRAGFIGSDRAMPADRYEALWRASPKAARPIAQNVGFGSGAFDPKSEASQLNVPYEIALAGGRRLVDNPLGNSCVPDAHWQPSYRRLSDQ
jgi:hypothetical protein